MTFRIFQMATVDASGPQTTPAFHGKKPRPGDLKLGMRTLVTDGVSTMGISGIMKRGWTIPNLYGGLDLWENHRTQWMFHRQWILCTAKPSEKVTIQWSGRIVRSHRYPICTTNQHFVGVSHPLVFFIRGAKAASSYEQQNLFWKFTSLQYLYIGQHISCVFNTTTHGNFECQKWRI